MAGTKWVYITFDPLAKARWVYITNDPKKGESVFVTTNQRDADEWVRITNNPKHPDWVYVTNPSSLPSDVDTSPAARGNSGAACGCILLLVIAFVFWTFGDLILSSISSPQTMSSSTPSPTLPRRERTLTPTPTLTPEVNDRCPTWKTVRKDLSGSRYDIWLQFVSTQPRAMKWSDFKDESLICNPVLIEDGFTFINGKEYLLP